MTKKIFVYVAGPYSKGDVSQNVRKAIDAAETLSEEGYIPLLPHLNHLWHMFYCHSYEYWLAYDRHFINFCDCILRIPGESAGADDEVQYAQLLGLPVFFDVDALNKYYRGDTTGSNH